MQAAIDNTVRLAGRRDQGHPICDSTLGPRLHGLNVLAGPPLVNRRAKPTHRLVADGHRVARLADVLGATYATGHAPFTEDRNLIKRFTAGPTDIYGWFGQRRLIWPPRLVTGRSQVYRSRTVTQGGGAA
ncbi:hypothetical protein GCM10011594_40230 [Nakamurella endophytica]|uniref:Uncharacterized protein n=1 Tax=Nakamurella endophytica TaxID=1748367 RepID=A0A917WMC3_9ACTN|nr:hypothetical protein GCM10011594_40230 [Nakamurella endophytica]